jgi:heterodisulfide reductase subunit C1
MTITQSIKSDIRFNEALSACMSCGVCTAICPAAVFYDYDPRQICTIVQDNDDSAIETLLKSDAIWQCGQCMSCKTRCPRGNVPGMLIQILRKESQKRGWFMQSEMGKLQRDIVENIGNNLYRTGYCVTPDLLIPQNHPELGPVWEWIFDHKEDVFAKVGSAYRQEKEGALRNIPDESLNELRRIFEVTGCMDFFDAILEPAAADAKNKIRPN